MQKTFCLAFHKSGTTSMHVWFERAGMKSLHYPKHVDGHDYARLIRPIIHDNREILRVLAPVIAAYDAHSDAPWPGLYCELADLYPQARFILIRRDPESWWEPRFTNEVQHQFMVVPWDRITDIFHWTSAVRLPGYKPKGVRSGKSLQLWIARHRALLGS